MHSHTESCNKLAVAAFISIGTFICNGGHNNYIFGEYAAKLGKGCSLFCRILSAGVPNEFVLCFFDLSDQAVIMCLTNKFAQDADIFSLLH